jgi:hypothetical protein
LASSYHSRNSDPGHPYNHNTTPSWIRRSKSISKIDWLARDVDDKSSRHNLCGNVSHENEALLDRLDSRIRKHHVCIFQRNERGNYVCYDPIHIGIDMKRILVYYCA